MDASEKDRLLELLKLAGGRFTERHTYHMGKAIITHVTVETFSFRIVHEQANAPTREAVIQEQRKPGRPRKQEGKL